MCPTGAPGGKIKDASCSRIPTWRATIHAGQYRPISLRLAAASQRGEATALAQNQCGSAGLHSVVTAAGDFFPLIFAGSARELRVPAAQIEGEGFHVTPDAETTLIVQFVPLASTTTPATNAVQITPVFSVAQKALCEISAASDLASESHLSPEIPAEN